jgi:Raf kinase inhibitor-like YbhB/YbcL family protein
MAQAMQTSLTLQSAAFPPGSPIPARHSEDGEDLSPSISWGGVPPGTRELALIVDDPDAPTREPWVHWVIYGIAPDAGELPEGISREAHPAEVPRARQGKNTWGTIGYRGPAPPKGQGEHRYHFSLFALARPLNLGPGADKKSLLKAMEGNILGRAELIGTYER